MSMDNEPLRAAAFPVQRYEGSWIDGMSLRDYFAAKAMQAMLAAQMKREGDATIPNLAKDAYRMADGMLAARSA
jgi:hypothetical protein